MRILHIITSLEAGGAEAMLFKLVRTMKSTSPDIENQVLTLVPKGKYINELESLGISLHTLDMKKGAPTLRALVRCWKTIRKIQPDVVQSWMYHSNLIASLTTPLSIPLFWNIRQSLYSLKREKWHTALAIVAHFFLGWRPRKIIFNSYTSMGQHKKFLGIFANKSAYIPNGFDPQEFYPDLDARAAVRKKLNIADETIVLGNFSRFHPMKNHELLFQAAQRLITGERNIKLLLAGSGISQDNTGLTEKLSKYGLTDHAYLLGECNSLNAYMNAIDIYVQTSAWGEAFPNVLGEAIFCERKIIATDVGDSSNILNIVNEETIPQNSVDVLVDTLKKMFTIKPKNAFNNFKSTFRIESIAQQYLSLYSSSKPSV